MYRLQAKLVLALAIVASGAELGTNDRGLSNASDEVEGLALQGLSEPHTGQVPLAPASRLGRQLLRLVVGVRYKILDVLLWYPSGSAAGFLVGDLVGF